MLTLQVRERFVVWWRLLWLESGRALREQLLGQSGDFSCEGIRRSQLIRRGGGPRVVVRDGRGEVVGGVRRARCTPEQRVLGREAITFLLLLEKCAVSQQSGIAPTLKTSSLPSSCNIPSPLNSLWMEEVPQNTPSECNETKSYPLQSLTCVNCPQ